MSKTPWVKICCISSVAEAALAVLHNVNALGLVSSMPSGPGVIDLKTIQQIAATVPPHVETVLLTSETRFHGIAEQVEFTAVRTLQLVDDVDSSVRQQLRTAFPLLRILQVIHVVDNASVQHALHQAQDASVDGLLLDSGNPQLAVKELGGTGRTHNWELSQRIVQGSRVPVILAGGLNAANVRDALGRVGPAGLDICSGVRSKGALDPAKLAAFCDAAGVTAGSPLRE